MTMDDLINRTRDLQRQFEEEEDESLVLNFNTDELDESGPPDIFSSVSNDDLITLTNFDIQAFNELFFILSDDIINLRSNRGRKQRLSEKDLLLLFLSYLKSYLSGKYYARDFRISTDAVHRLIDKMINKFHATLKRSFIDSVELENAAPQQAFPEVKLVVDCSVQEVPRFSGNFTDAKIFFSPKHGKYCLKREYAHVRSGKVIHVSEPFPGSKHDFSVFLTSLEYYKTLLKKEGRDDFWSIMADKGYEGIRNYINSVTPVKGRNLSFQETVFNQEIGSFRIICENYYGRMKVLWGAARNKFRGPLENFEKINDICVSLTNFHLTSHPLRRSDGIRYRRINNPDSINFSSQNSSAITDGMDNVSS